MLRYVVANLDLHCFVFVAKKRLKACMGKRHMLTQIILSRDLNHQLMRITNILDRGQT